MNGAHTRHGDGRAAPMATEEHARDRVGGETTGSAAGPARPQESVRCGAGTGNVTPVSSSETVHNRCCVAWSWESGLDSTSFG